MYLKKQGSKIALELKQFLITWFANGQEIVIVIVLFKKYISCFSFSDLLVRSK